MCELVRLLRKCLDLDKQAGETQAAVLLKAVVDIASRLLKLLKICPGRCYRKMVQIRNGQRSPTRTFKSRTLLYDWS